MQTDYYILMSDKGIILGLYEITGSFDVITKFHTITATSKTEVRKLTECGTLVIVNIPVKWFYKNCIKIDYKIFNHLTKPFLKKETISYLGKHVTNNTFTLPDFHIALNYLIDNGVSTSMYEVKKNKSLLDTDFFDALTYGMRELITPRDIKGHWIDEVQKSSFNFPPSSNFMPILKTFRGTEKSSGVLRLKLKLPFPKTKYKVYKGDEFLVEGFSTKDSHVLSNLLSECVKGNQHLMVKDKNGEVIRLYNSNITKDFSFSIESIV